jgi:acylpyruvate hydrolase
MQLVRFRGTRHQAYAVGLHVDGVVYDLTMRYPTVAAFIAAFPDGWTAGTVGLEGLPQQPRGAVELGPPIDEASTLYLVGANYRKHAEEAGLDVPEIPVIFSKPATALVGPGQPIRLPAISSQMDYEGELAVMIGREATRVSKHDAPRHVSGYTVVNDVTARDLQWVQLGKHRIVDWFSSKCLDQSTPVGPWIVPAATAGDPHGRHLTTQLNGETMQDSDTSLMVFSVWDLIEFISARVTLRPGDIISTGTPFGVGGFRKIFLKDGDVLRVEVGNVGVLENPVAPAEPAV